ncbi:MAG: THUMP domain-containing class I SAM-dependent RNA methyltransferase [Syntrophobacteraceae bacterium]
MAAYQIHTGGFSRRVKTHIAGPEHRFAIVVPPELARICLNETRWLDIPQPELSDAGLEFSGRLKDAYTCNLWLRTASRVLCRLAPFRAGAVEELFHKASRIPWELWLNPDVKLHIGASVEYSRISHEGRVAEVISESIEKSLREKGPLHPPDSRVKDSERSAPGGSTGSGRRPDDSELKQKILVRLLEDHCRISIDMSGAHLHQRGYRLRHTGAPLRETLAAAILLKSGWTGNEPLVDGMCGSGTFPIEGALMSRRIAPGLGRDFLFQGWPSFQNKTWEYLRRKAKEISVLEGSETIIGMDIDPDAIGVSTENADRAGAGGDIQWEKMDFFDFNPRKRGLRKGLLVLNPPYGVRLSAGGVGLYERIGAHLRLNFKGWKYAVLAGSRLEAAAMGTGRVRLWNIRHGGMHITVVLGRIAA